MPTDRAFGASNRNAFGRRDLGRANLRGGLFQGLGSLDQLLPTEHSGSPVLHQDRQSWRDTGHDPSLGTQDAGVGQ
jgi:hypothetical protein